MPDLFHTEKKPITSIDRDRLGSDLARVALTMDTIEDEQGSMNRAFRVKLRQLKEQKKTLSRQLDSGEVEHRIAVEEVHDDSRMVVQVLRADTRELVTQRPMNEAEKLAATARKQVEMFGDGDDDDDDGPRDTDRRPPPARRSGTGPKAGKPRNGKAKRR